MQKPIRIGIDARELSKNQPGGFRSYIRGLLHGLAEIDGTNEYLLYLDRPIEQREGFVPKNSTLRVLSGGRLLVDWLAFARCIKMDGPDIMHFACNYGLGNLDIPTVISLHDCISLGPAPKRTSLRSRLLSEYSALMTRRSVPAADALVTMSEYSRSQILRYFPGVQDRVAVTHLAGSIKGASHQKETAGHFSDLVAGDYVLVLASVDPRKNVDLAIEAFSQTTAASEGCVLVAVCSHPSAAAMVSTKAEQCGVGSRAAILTGVSDGELCSLYRHCTAFVFASLEEGFGLPPLEAMGHGCPVISSNTSSMPEILGDAAVYFDPLDREALSQAIDLVWQSNKLRASLRERGLERASQFSWRKTAEATLSVYRRVLDRRRER